MVYFRCLDERHISGEIHLMKWNPKMDLIVLSLTSGDIILHRLVSWQKVWHMTSPKLKVSTNTNTGNDLNDGQNSNNKTKSKTLIGDLMERYWPLLMTTITITSIRMI